MAARALAPRASKLAALGLGPRAPSVPELSPDPVRLLFALSNSVATARRLGFVKVGARTSQPRSGARQSRLL